MNSSDTKRVCVAICNYNHSKYLAQSIKSITEQTYSNLDIVVVDDASSDAQVVEDIVSSFGDKRIRFIQLPQNRGKWNALNTAFSSTDAALCTSHDADDFSLPWRIAAQVEVLMSTKTLHNLCGFVSCLSDDDMLTAQVQMQQPNELQFLSGDKIFGAVMHGYNTPGINHYYTGTFETHGASALFYRRVWDLGFRFLPPSQNLRVLMSEDSDFNFRVTTGLRSTSLLQEKPYLYRRNTSTNKEEM